MSSTNVIIGEGAGASLTTGADDILIGTNAGNQLTTGSYAVAIGENALASQPAFAPSYIDPNGLNTNIAIGPNALTTTTVSWGNVAIGRNALQFLTANPSTPGSPDDLTANYNVAIGDQAGQSITTGSENMLIGNHTGLSLTTGTVNTAMGSETLKECTTGVGNAAYGVSALQGLLTGSYNTAVGNGAGGLQANPNALTTGSDNTFLGSNTIPNSTTQHSYMTVIGADSTGDRNSTIYLGRIADTVIIGGVTIETTAGLSIGAGNTARAAINLGANAPASPTAGDIWFNAGVLNFQGLVTSQILNDTTFYLSPTTGGYTGGGNIWIGRYVGNTTLAPATGNGQAANNTVVGNACGQSITSGFDNTIVGFNSGNAITTGHDNALFGCNLLPSLTTGFDNVVFGSQVGAAMTSATQNVLVGYSAGQAITDGTSNVIMGVSIGNAQTTAYGNVLIGYSSATGLTGSTNVVIGYNTGNGVTSGAGNTIVGSGITGLSSSLSNTLILAAGNIQLIVADGTSVRPQTPLVTLGYTVAALPTPSASLLGARAHVTDAVGPTFLSPLNGGGSTVCPVFCNGSAWVAG